jgi:hypothetical protein
MHYLSYILIFLAISLIIFFGYENNILRKQLFEMENLRKEHQVFLGRKVKSLEVKNKNQESVIINFNEQKLPTIIYVFSPYCQWCEKNLENSVALYQRTKDRYNFIALSIDRDSLTKGVIEENDKLPFQVTLFLLIVK